jgi:hypothetical protein
VQNNDGTQNLVTQAKLVNQNTRYTCPNIIRGMKSVTYASVYNILYEHKNETNYDIDVVLHDILQACKTRREKLWMSRHMLKIITTQSIGGKADPKIIKDIKRMHHISQLDSRLLLRKLQHAALRRIYRPEGRFIRTKHEEFTNTSSCFHD